MGLLTNCPCFCIRTVAGDEVKELDYSHACLEDVPANVFSHERTLEIIKLESNQIRDLPRVSPPQTWPPNVPLARYDPLIRLVSGTGPVSLRTTSRA